MAETCGKQASRRRQRPKPKTPFDQRLLQLEREINKLAREVRDYKKQYSDLKPKRGRKPKGSTNTQSVELNVESLRIIEHIGVEMLMDSYNIYVLNRKQ